MGIEARDQLQFYVMSYSNQKKKTKKRGMEYFGLRWWVEKVKGGERAMVENVPEHLERASCLPWTTSWFRSEHARASNPTLR